MVTIQIHCSVDDEPEVDDDDEPVSLYYSFGREADFACYGSSLKHCDSSIITEQIE